MSFINPSILWALFALLIPIIIHLFDFQRPKKVLFTNVKILQSVSQKTNKSRTIKNLLLLMSRLTFIFFLVLAFAQPFSSESTKTIQDKTSLKQIFIDNSMSMKSVSNEKTLIDQALESTQKLIDLHNESVKFQLFTNDLTSNKTLAKAQITDQLSELKLSASSKYISDVVTKMNYNNSERNLNKATQFIFSNFQKSTIGDLKSIEFDSANTVHLIPIVPDPKSSNFYVDSLWIKNYFIKRSEKNTISVNIARSGGGDKVKKNVKLYIDGTTQSASMVEIAANQTVTIDFDIQINSDSTHLCSIEIDDQPVDFDNTFYFTLDPISKVAILEISKSKNPYFEKLFEGEDQFLYRHNYIGKISQIEVEKADLIIIDGFDQLNSSEISLIKSQTDVSKTVALIPSEKPSVELCKTAYQSLGISLNLDEGSKEKLSLVLPDVSNPFFANVFEKQDKNLVMPFGKQTINLQKKGLALMKFSNESYFATKYNSKGANFVLFSNSLATSETDLPNHALFVALFYRIAINASKNLNRTSYMLNTPQKYTYISSSPKNEKRIVLKTKNTEYVPEYRNTNGLVEISIPEIAKEPGFYTVLENGLENGMMALNYQKNESKLECYTLEELKQAFAMQKNVLIAENYSSESFIDTYAKLNFGIEWWKYCIAAALFFLFVEIMIIKFFN